MLDGSKFSSKNAYLNLQDSQRDDATSLIWESRAPARVKIFAWLMHLDKLNTRQKLHHKGLLDSPFCPACPHIIEDKMHLFFECTVAQQIWLTIGLQPLHAGKMQPSSQLPPSVWPTILLAILWKIWDTRNALVFRDQVLTPSQSIANVISDLSLWLHRFKTPKFKEDTMSWRDYLSACNSIFQT
jgi:hypothetical protein